MTDQALSDLKVVEWGSFISAPFCTKLMADMGAEVIKVEPPATGDEARQQEQTDGNACGHSRPTLKMPAIIRVAPNMLFMVMV